ncbi:unannotated protein [freshwater metagenome]|uniref:Unannotated protein n=1 Tax=freshwater metagenome TaxID=449393 RepID=A0A6J6H296_9ZZZZ
MWKVPAKANSGEMPLFNLGIFSSSILILNWAPDKLAVCGLLRNFANTCGAALDSK